MLDNKSKFILSFVLILSGINYYLYSKKINELKDVINNIKNEQK
jgi:hypothetical protein